MTYFELIDKLKEIGKKTKWVITPQGQIRQKDKSVCPICAIANDIKPTSNYILDWMSATIDLEIPYWLGARIAEAADKPSLTIIRKQLIETLSPEVEDKVA